MTVNTLSEAELYYKKSPTEFISVGHHIFNYLLFYEENEILLGKAFHAF